jgi:hypothetical protein
LISDTARAIGAIVAQLFLLLVGLATNVAYYNRFSTAFVSPAGSHRSFVVRTPDKSSA